MIKPGIFVVGSLHYDITVKASHLPIVDETVLGNSVEFVCGGKGGNQAVASSMHGAKVWFAGAVGSDFFADALIKNLVAHEINISQIQRASTTPSGMSVAILEEGGEYGAVVASGSNQQIISDQIQLPRGVSHVVLQNEIPEHVNLHIAKLARKSGHTIILNAAPMREMSVELLKLVDVLIVNKVEASGLFGKPINSVEDAVSLAEQDLYRFSLLIITLGDQGLVYRQVQGRTEYLPPKKVELISSHGAGDHFVGAFCTEFAAGKNALAAMKYASTAAAIFVSSTNSEKQKISRQLVSRLMD